jgi:hypothetical protein
VNLQKRWIGHAHLQEIEQPMADTLEKLKKKVLVGVVGGSDYVKIQEQLGGGKSVWLSQAAFRCVICGWIAVSRAVSSCWENHSSDMPIVNCSRRSIRLCLQREWAGCIPQRRAAAGNGMQRPCLQLPLSADTAAVVKEYHRSPTQVSFAVSRRAPVVPVRQ